MFSKRWIGESTQGFSESLARLRETFEEADAVLIGAGAGLSAAAGLAYSGRRFEARFGDFIAKYHYSDMYTAGFYHYGSREEYWAYWSRHVWLNRYSEECPALYRALRELVNDKTVFVLTTNVDHCFQKAGFDKGRLFYTQGDYGLFQCSRPCCQRTYDNREAVQRMVTEQKDMRVPSELLPQCPVCGAPLILNLRCDDRFVQDEGWYQAQNLYAAFLHKYQSQRILLWELGVGGNTPVIIKYPFWQMARDYPNARYACVNLEDAFAPQEIAGRSICMKYDISEVLFALHEQQPD